MRKAYNKAIKKIVDANSALQNFATFITFKDFGEFEPSIGFVNEYCIVVSYSDVDQIHEISGEEAMRIMSEKGCITPDDF